MYLLLNSLNTLDYTGKPLPTEFRLFSFGSNPAHKIGVGDLDIQFTNADAQRIMDNYKADSEILIDYEHGSLMSMGSPAPASGWAKLALRADGLYAVDVKWTKRASDMISSGEYRYMSPAVEQDEDGMYQMLSIGLTNMPALQNTEALMMNKFSTTKKDNIMANEKDTESLSKILALSGAKNIEEALGMIQAAKENQDRIKQLEQDNKSKEVAALISAAKHEGRLAPSRQAEMEQFAEKYGVDGLRMCLSMLPVANSTVATRAVQPNATTEQKKHSALTLSRKQIAIARAANLTAQQLADKLNAGVDQILMASPFFKGVGTGE